MAGGGLALEVGIGNVLQCKYRSLPLRKYIFTVRYIRQRHGDSLSGDTLMFPVNKEQM